MIKHVGRKRDSSFLCLLTIYAAHVVLFHVINVTPFFGTTNLGLYKISRSHFHRLIDRSNGSTNSTNMYKYNSNSFGITGSSNNTNSNNKIYGKVDVQKVFNLRDLHSEPPKTKIFSTVALSSSSWGIISGCAIFLLTYTDRENTL